MDEALTYLRHGVAARGGLNGAELAPLERAVSAFLLTLNAALLEAADEPPPAQPLSALRERGFSATEEEDFRRAPSAAGCC